MAAPVFCGSFYTKVVLSLDKSGNQTFPANTCIQHKPQVSNLTLSRKKTRLYIICHMLTPEQRNILNDNWELGA